MPTESRLADIEWHRHHDGSEGWPCDTMTVLALGDALLTEMHGTTGCDPNCEVHYHGVFRQLTTDEEFLAIRGPNLTEAEWDAHLEANHAKAD